MEQKDIIKEFSILIISDDFLGFDGSDKTDSSIRCFIMVSTVVDMKTFFSVTLRTNL